MNLTVMFLMMCANFQLSDPLECPSFHLPMFDFSYMNVCGKHPPRRHQNTRSEKNFASIRANVMEDLNLSVSHHSHEQVFQKLQLGIF